MAGDRKDRFHIHVQLEYQTRRALKINGFGDGFPFFFFDDDDVFFSIDDSSFSFFSFFVILYIKLKSKRFVGRVLERYFRRKRYFSLEIILWSVLNWFLNKESFV